MKLKKKLEFQGHVYFEPVSPEKVQAALIYTKANNPLYRDVEIHMDNIQPDLLSYDENEEIYLLIETDSESNDLESNDLESDENPLNNFRQVSSESCTITPAYDSEFVELAPGEGKNPSCIITDEHCEELAFPKIFSKGIFGYKAKINVPLSPVKYFNQWLLTYKQIFASVTDCIFFAQFVLQQLMLRSQISIAMQKVSGNLTASMFINYKETVQSFIGSDQGYVFMNHIKGTPAFWKRFQLEVLAMIRQLGCPAFFLTLSYADLHWQELVKIISQINGLAYSDAFISSLNFFQRCEILNSNPVIVARHFQYKVEILFAEILMIPTGPLGKIKYYAIRVEFQVRGSPHIHSFIWILNPPTLSEQSIDEYVEFIDTVIQAYLPNENEDPELYHLVKTQVHQHSKSCRKYKNIDCRYGFGHFFSDKTLIARPLSKDISLETKAGILSNRSSILCKVKAYVDEFLNPNKVSYIHDITVSQILLQLGFSEEDYHEALSISTSDDYEVHMRRPPNSSFVNEIITRQYLTLLIPGLFGGSSVPGGLIRPHPLPLHNFSISYAFALKLVTAVHQHLVNTLVQKKYDDIRIFSMTSFFPKVPNFPSKTFFN